MSNITRRTLLAGAALAWTARSAAAAVDADAVNAAAFTTRTPVPSGDIDPFIVKLQVLLDRAHASPGVIDGIDGGNVRKAVRAARVLLDLPAGDTIDARLWHALDRGGPPVLTSHRITAKNLEGPFAPDLPEDYAELAKLERIAFRTPREMFAERFHMDDDLLQALNPDSRFDRVGETIVVAAPGEPLKPEGRLSKVVVEVRAGTVRALRDNGRLLVAYPASVGSPRTPSPHGTHTVTAVARNPNYTYNPEINFTQGNNRRVLRLAPGPNNPVGTVWIDLSEPTYGLHGTPEPAKIDKAGSHGCVRLTNWDAEELAGLVHVGLTVEFVR